MILIGLGSNLTSEAYDTSQAVLRGALAKIAEKNIKIVKLSNFYHSEPVPKSDQPWYVNAVARLETDHKPEELLHILHAIEHEMGRLRRERWGSRIIDLDILAYDNIILPSAQKWKDSFTETENKQFILPHPRMHDRLFVLRPLMDVAPNWLHPIFHKTAENLLAENRSSEVIHLMKEG